MTEARDKALRERKAKRNPNRCNPDTEFTLGFDAGAEEVGRLEREVAILRAEKDSPHADAKYWVELQAERAGRAKDYEWMKAKVGEVAAERHDALAVIERVKAARSDHPTCTVHDAGDPITCGWKRAVLDIDAALAEIGPALAGVKAEVLEEAADHLPFIDRPRNLIVRQQDAAHWLRARAAQIRAGN
jgi:hypothetical protein